MLTMPFWATTRYTYISQVVFVFMYLSETLLFKFGRTDKNMTLVGKSWIQYILRERSLLAESTVQMIKNQKVAVNATK